MPEPREPPSLGRVRSCVLLFPAGCSPPGINLAADACSGICVRTYQLFGEKHENGVNWDAYLDNLYPLDWFVASACLEGNSRAVAAAVCFPRRPQRLPAGRWAAAGGSALSRDEERQESAGQEFWKPPFRRPSIEGSLPVLARVTTAKGRSFPG